LNSCWKMSRSATRMRTTPISVAIMVIQHPLRGSCSYLFLDHPPNTPRVNPLRRHVLLQLATALPFIPL
ncbi:MAG: hypothetical protein M3157_06770, partial [Actinomycetota bacterium]|nr:hypothetical protein [Actinomycetota bacterium]